MIQHLYTLQSGHHNKSSNHPAFSFFHSPFSRDSLSQVGFLGNRPCMQMEMEMREHVGVLLGGTREQCLHESEEMGLGRG